MSQDTKRLILGMMLALGVIIAYNQMLRVFYPNWKPEQQQTQTTQPSTALAATAPSTTRTTTTQAATTQSTVAAPATQGTLIARGGAATQPVVLGSGRIDDPNYVMAVQLVQRGAAVNQVTLNKYQKNVADKLARFSFQEPYSIGGTLREDSRSLITRSLTIDGATVDLSSVNWKLEKATQDSAHWTVDIIRGESTIARVHKFYVLPRASKDAATNQGWEVSVYHQVENLTGQPQVVKAVFDGPLAPPNELERQPDQNLIVGHLKDGATEVFARLLESEFTAEKPTLDFTKSEKGRPVVWGGMQSAYFDAISRPLPLAANESAAGWIVKSWGELLNPSTQVPSDKRIVIHFETADFTIAPEKITQFAAETYFGPKGRQVLNSAYYDAPPRDYDNTLIVSSSTGFCAWVCGACSWPWLINILVGLLSFFYMITRDWGIAIIILVVLVRALLHPITKKSQVHMVKMQKMGPELEKLKKKYADDKEALAREQMKFYKEQGFTPILGCLPMFLQMPIWIALWNSLQSTFELRLSPFLYGLTWIKDLAKPDYLVKFDNPIPLFFGMTLSGINLLPLLMGVVFYLQTKLQPKPVTMTPEQESQQKMMTWMSTLMFPLFLYSGPSGLNLYILTSTAFGILESKVIRDHIKQREELEARMGPTIIDAPPPGKGGQKSGKDQPAAPAKKGWLQRLMEKAEEVKRQAEKDRGKK